VQTGADGLEDDGHRLVFAAMSPVIRSSQQIDQIILADWSHHDYQLFLNLVYGRTDRWVNTEQWTMQCNAKC
jgi:hypothetical protein